MKRQTVLFGFVALVLVGGYLHARDIDRTKVNRKGARTEAAQFNDLRRNTVSKVQFMITNYGIFGLDVARNQGGGFWPRGSGNEYIFGGGIWFGAIKVKDGVPRKLSVISYNPNSGASWMTPGSIDDGEQADRTPDAVLKNRVYMSTDFIRANGIPRNATDGPNWPIWDSDPNDTLANRSVIKDRTRYLGHYINDISKRNSSTYPKGPAFISQEDIFTIYKDTDLRAYELGEDAAKNEGYPLRLQFEQTVYTWGFGEYANFYFIRFNIINRSSDTLYECWMAPAFDFDLAYVLNAQSGAGNDRVSYYFSDTTLNLAYQWTNTDRGERGRRFGYVGMTFLESPAVDGQGFIRHDKLYYTLPEQLGLQTFRNWVIDVDPKTPIERYDFMASRARDGDTGPGDKRFLMATGPFNMVPGDTARVVVGTIFALPVKDEADGSEEDLANLVRRTRFAQRVYDNGFAAPEPPEPPRVTTEPLNHAILVKWDTTSYTSNDRNERGMDIMGFRIYRARVINQDTFDVDYRSPSADYPSGRGPFAWKQIAEWTTPSPFSMTAILSDSGNVASARYPWIRIFPHSSKSSYRLLYPSLMSGSDVTNDSVILVRRLPNTATEPWRSFWTPLIPQQSYSNPIRYDTLTLGIIRVLPGGTLPTMPTTTTDTATMNQAMQILWPQVTSGTVSIRWLADDWVDQPWARAIIRNYLDSITNGRAFLDVGDDNHDGIISQDDDLRKREEILNNVDYYYKVVALDEGDYIQATPVKTSISVDLINVVQAFALASGPRKEPTISATFDPNQLGGLYDFQLVPKDADRFAQLFAGHEIELEFRPMVSGFSGYPCLDTLWNNNASFLKGLYGNELIVRDKTTGKELQRYTVLYEPADCLFDNFYSDVAMAYVSPQTAQLLTFCDDLLRGAGDTSLFVHPLNTSVAARGGSWTTDKGCFGDTRTIAGTFAVTFNYYIQQFGGIFRPYRIAKLSGDANTFLEYRPRRIDQIAKAEQVAINYRKQMYERFNNGAGTYEVEFLPGGVETITTTFLRRRGLGQFDTLTRTFDASYLNVRVRNVRTYKRPSPTGDSVLVQYGNEIPHAAQSLPADVSDYNQDGSTTLVPYPHPKLVPIGQFNLSAYAWKNGRYTKATLSQKEAVTARDTQAASSNRGAPVGTQGRYYLSTVTPDGDTIDFTHAFVIDGATFWLDFPGKGGRQGTASGRLIPFPPDSASATQDFKPGDKIVIETMGGPFGFPLPGAKVTFKVSDTQIAQDQLTDTDLDRVLIVPNPYVITHVGQKSSYDAKIYFTRLPKECTIKIYTVAGDLIRTIHHIDQDGTFRYGMDVWDLLSDNRQRAVSQGLIAVIETPNGAQTVKKFAIVVGGARILGR